MEKYEKLLSATVIAAGLVLLGLCLKGGVDNFTNKDRRVTVKGLAEREVDADKVTWTMNLQESGDELEPIFSHLNVETAAVKKYLDEKGTKGKVTVNVGSFDVTNNLANAWGGSRPFYNYSVSRAIRVTSTDTKLISALMQNADELIERGVILQSSYSNFEYTKFQQLKPEMMADAIANAEKTAQQFAENSHSKINKIVEAGQGEFSIDEADTPYKKKVRVVSTITYSLKD